MHANPPDSPTITQTSWTVGDTPLCTPFGLAVEVQVSLFDTTEEIWISVTSGEARGDAALWLEPGRNSTHSLFLDVTKWQAVRGRNSWPRTQNHFHYLQ